MADISGDMNHVYRVGIVATPPHRTADSASEANSTATTGHTSWDASVGPTEAGSGTGMGKRSFSVIVKMAPKDVLVRAMHAVKTVACYLHVHVHVHVVSEGG